MAADDGERLATPKHTHVFVSPPVSSCHFCSNDISALIEFGKRQREMTETLPGFRWVEWSKWIHTVCLSMLRLSWIAIHENS